MSTNRVNISGDVLFFAYFEQNAFFRVSRINQILLRSLIINREKCARFGLLRYTMFNRGPASVWQYQFYPIGTFVFYLSLQYVITDNTATYCRAAIICLLFRFRCKTSVKMMTPLDDKQISIRVWRNCGQCWFNRRSRHKALFSAVKSITSPEMTNDRWRVLHFEHERRQRRENTRNRTWIQTKTAHRFKSRRVPLRRWLRL